MNTPRLPLADYHVHPHAYQANDRPVRNVNARRYLTSDAIEVLRELNEACWNPTEAHEACDPRSQ